MVKSMTGFGHGEAANHDYKVSVEVRSINNRYLEAVARVPKQIISLEDPIKKLVNKLVSRGRVDVFVTLEDSDQREKTLKVDKELALAYWKSIQEVADVCKVGGGIRLVDLVKMPGLFSMEKPDDDLEAIWLLVQEALNSALNKLIEMRQIEGDKLAEDLLARRLTIIGWVEEIARRSPIVVDEYQEKLSARIKELLDDKAAFDEGRFANEVAYFADRASITEEIIRLGSHLDQLKALLKSPDVVGRKLDFLMQELNREINTVGSKANDLQINRLVIDVKSELEKIREQVQNIE